jgi:hypothetical protein
MGFSSSKPEIHLNMYYLKIKFLSHRIYTASPLERPIGLLRDIIVVYSESHTKTYIHSVEKCSVLMLKQVVHTHIVITVP